MLYTYEIFISMFETILLVFIYLFSWTPQIENLAIQLILKNELEMARCVKGKYVLVI